MSMPSVWLSHTASDRTTADMGWYIIDGGRSCPPPSPNEHTISVPYRNGDFDVGVALGLSADYPSRELSYTLAKPCGDASELAQWAALCRGAELTDGCTGDVFQNVIFKSMTCGTDASNVQQATITFKADPFKKGGKL